MRIGLNVAQQESKRLLQTHQLSDLDTALLSTEPKLPISFRVGSSVPSSWLYGMPAGRFTDIAASGVTKAVLFHANSEVGR
jgi:hypothetical protein